MSEQQWLVFPPTAGPTTRRLFCLPYAGGGAGIFRSWVPYLDAGTELWALRLPGRESRFGEPLLTDVPTVVAQLVESVRVATDLPYAVFGFSMGALIGYELCLALQASGAVSPSLLAVGGHNAPHHPRERPQLAFDTDAELTALLVELGGTPPEVLESPELLALVLPTLRADFTMVERYRSVPAPRLTCRVATYNGADDVEVSQVGTEAWQDVCQEPVRHRLFPGGHFFIDAERAALLRQLQNDIGDVLP